MLANFLNRARRAPGHKPSSYNWKMIVILVVWVFFGFMLASSLVKVLANALETLGAPLASFDQTIVNAVAAVIVYTLSLVIVVGGPWLARRHRTTKAELGLARMPEWFDLLLGPAGFLLYLLASGFVIYAVTQLVPGFNASQQQEIGFSNLMKQYELLLAFVTLVIIAPIAEETLFRGYLYGMLRRYVPIWAAIVATSALFGFLHGQWNVGIDVFVMSVVMCTLREVTGSIWAGILLHMTKNGLAFFLLFIYPVLHATMGA